LDFTLSFIFALLCILKKFNLEFCISRSESVILKDATTFARLPTFIFKFNFVSMPLSISSSI